MSRRNSDANLKTARRSTTGTVAAGAPSMVPFAGYEMPVQYPTGIMAEHQMDTRAPAGLFDVSHMGQSFDPRRKEGR